MNHPLPVRVFSSLPTWGSKYLYRNSWLAVRQAWVSSWFLLNFRNLPMNRRQFSRFLTIFLPKVCLKTSKILFTSGDSSSSVLLILHTALKISKSDYIPSPNISIERGRSLLKYLCLQTMYGSSLSPFRTSCRRSGRTLWLSPLDLTSHLKLSSFISLLMTSTKLWASFSCATSTFSLPLMMKYPPLSSVH